MDDFELNRYKIFEALCRSNFDFLEKTYKFCIEKIDMVDCKSIVIKYGTKDVFVKISYGSPSFELHFTFGIKGKHDTQKSIPLNSGDLVLLEKNHLYKDYAAFSATSYENLILCLPKLAELLKKCGPEFLKGNLGAYKELEKKRDEVFKDWQEERELKDRRLKAEYAWNNKDYSAVVETFLSIHNYLSNSEKKKLELAQKMVREKK